MKSYNQIVCGVCLVLLSVSCTPIYYKPNTQNVPLFSEQGEIRASLLGNANQAEVQGAYAVSNHIGLLVNGGLFFPESNDNGDGGFGKFAELGAGYFHPLGNGFVFETYGLAGIGDVRNHFPGTVSQYPGTTGKVNATLYRFGIQPAIGYKTKYFSAAVSSRLVNLLYGNIDGDLTFGGVNQAGYLKENNSHILIEPALTARGGIDWLQVQLQVVTGVNLTNDNFQQDHSTVTLGVIFNLNSGQTASRAKD